MKKILLLFFTASHLIAHSQSVTVNAPFTADTAFKVYNEGSGPVSSFITNNTDNTGPLIYGPLWERRGIKNEINERAKQ